MIVIQTFLPNGTINDELHSTNKKCLTISNDGNMLIVDYDYYTRPQV
jgi:hypothetical protein